MDSKRMRRAMFLMIGMFLAAFVVLVIVNLDTVKYKLGFAEKPQQQEEVVQQTEESETAGGQIGGNLNAFLGDETFFDQEVKFKSIESYAGRSVSSSSSILALA